jgi:hypothetical protein
MRLVRSPERDFPPSGNSGLSERWGSSERWGYFESSELSENWDHLKAGDHPCFSSPKTRVCGQ